MSFQSNLEAILLRVEKYNDPEGGLIKGQIINDAYAIDPELITALINDWEIKAKFFVSISGHWVFNINLFVTYIQEKNFLDNSYTNFKNKIGLTGDDDQLIRQQKEVVLVWPFKDCVLEGGQDKEDQKRQEIFFNETLAQDEIDRLLDPKVITKWERHTVSGSEKVTTIKRDASGTVSENLLIKGNNLLALHSLKREFTGKVKLIYIDPPYNTGNDGFGYNDRFNHSTWLTFMKNRLEVARELLRDDGVIFISCDDNEDAYLKVLLYEIFDKKNFVADFIWNHRKSSQNDIDVSLSHNYTVTIAKKRSNFKLNPLKIDESKFSNPDNDPRGDWVADPFDAPNVRPNLSYPIINPNTKEEYLPPEGRHWRFSKDKYDEALRENRIIFGKTGKTKPQYKRFKSEAQAKGTNVFTIWDDVGTATEATKELMVLMDGLKLFSTPKPERLMERIIQIGSNEGDIVLDFQAGSGTTGAVAHKMNRQWILVEQMDYIKGLPEERLIKVLKGEQGGVSQSVGWTGGGDFIYCELAKYNEIYVEMIRDTTTTEELWKVWLDMEQNAFLDYRIETHEVTADGFRAMTFEAQQKLLMECLDKNQMYVNLTEIDDEDYKISDEDKDLNLQFYKNYDNR